MALSYSSFDKWKLLFPFLSAFTIITGVSYCGIVHRAVALLYREGHGIWPARPQTVVKANFDAGTR